MNREYLGVIPCAGEGSRLYPYPCPKELIPIGHQEILINGKYEKRPKVVSQYLVEAMNLEKVNNIMMVINSKKADIIKYYGNGEKFETSISYVCQNDSKGLPYAINEVFNWSDNKDIIVGLPDTLFKPDNIIQNMINKNEVNNSEIILGIFPVENHTKFGMVNIDSEKVINLIDKPQKTDLKYAWGIVLFKPIFQLFLNKYIENKTTNYEITLTEIINEAILSGMKCEYVIGEEFKDIGTYEELRMELIQTLS